MTIKAYTMGEDVTRNIPKRSDVIHNETWKPRQH